MMWYWDQGNGWAYAAMSVGMIAFWAMLVWAVVAIWRGDRRSWENLGPDRSSASSTPGPQGILAERFARGEIDADEYQRGLEVLHQRPTARSLTDS